MNIIANRYFFYLDLQGSPIFQVEFCYKIKLNNWIIKTDNQN